MVMATVMGATLVCMVLLLLITRMKKQSEKYEIARIFRQVEETRTVAPPSRCKKEVIPRREPASCSDLRAETRAAWVRPLLLVETTRDNKITVRKETE